MSKEYREYIDFDNTISINGEHFECIGAFAVIPYNEDSHEISDYLKVDVSYGQNQSSYLIFNMNLNYVRNKCLRQNIPSFLYCYMWHDELHCDKWEIGEKHVKHGLRKIYIKTEKTSEILTDNKNQICLIGKKGILNLDLNILRKANDQIKQRLDTFMKRINSVRLPKEELDHATNGLGMAAWYHRKAIYGNWCYVISNNPKIQH